MCTSVFAWAKTDTRAPLERPRYLRGAYIMNHKKLLLTLTLCLCALLCMVVTASASEVQGHSSHPICVGTTCTDPAHASHSDVTFEKAITMADNVLCIDGVKQTPNSNSSDNYEYTLSEGTYYLDGEITLDKGIWIQGNVTLCLNGHKITCDKFYVIQMLANSRVTFTLCDCIGTGAITHTANSTSNAGGVILGGSGANIDHSFIMYNGCITENKISGVYLQNKASFTMYGGSITQNGYNNTYQYGVYGGGVYVHTAATFTMYGGNITGNYADTNGGGVHVVSETANFTMYGGSITGNHTAGSGGGVNVNAGTITVGGNVNISGNWQGNENSSISNNNANNVYLPTNSTITIEKALTGKNSRIGVTTATSVATTPNASVKIAAGKGTYAITDEDKGHFTPDTGYCEVQKKDDGALYLTHVHSGGAVSYTWATDNTTCKAEHKCTACQHVENETVNTQKQVTQNRSCTLNELSTFTATFTNTAFARQIKENVKTADMTGHAFAAAWEHNDDKHWHKCTRDGCTGIDAEAAHEWQPATYTAPKTCVCGATQGEPLTRSYYYYAPSAAENKKDSPKAGDPGVLLYAGLALASLTGLAYTAKKRH